LPTLVHLSPQIVRHLNALADALSGADLPELARREQPPDGAELNRAQIREVLRASRLGRSVTIRVANGLDLLVRPPGKGGAGAPPTNANDLRTTRPRKIKA